MKGNSILVGLMFLTVIFSNCTSRYSTKVVAIDKIDTSGIYFSYDYQTIKYSGHFDLNEIEEDFSTSDSLKIKIERNQPDKFEFISVIERVWVTEESIVSLTESNENQIIYSYHCNLPLSSYI